MKGWLSSWRDTGRTEPCCRGNARSTGSTGSVVDFDESLRGLADEHKEATASRTDKLATALAHAPAAASQAKALLRKTATFLAHDAAPARQPHNPAPALAHAPAAASQAKELLRKTATFLADDGPPAQALVSFDP